MRLEGKIAIVTGASSGIGRATAKLFAQEGAKVVAAARRINMLEDLKKEVEEAGFPGSILPCQTDVRIPEQIDRMFDVTMKEYGTLDILVNNAGLLDGMTPIHLVDDDLYNLIYETDQRAVYLGCRKAVQIFLEQDKHGSIVNMGSAASLRGLRGGSMYVMTKHAVLGITRNISASYYERGIRCNCICPANIKSEINRAGRLLGLGIEEWQMRAAHAVEMNTITPPGGKPIIGKSEEVADLCLFLADENTSHYISGADIKIDAGYLNA